MSASFVVVCLLVLSVPSSPAAASPHRARAFDFNGDGYADLAVGIPGETLNGVNFTGEVQVLYGGRGGVSAASMQTWSQNSAGVGGANERRDNFGSGITSADFDGDGYADLAIGADGEDGTSNGSVTVLYGSRRGLTARGDQVLRAKTLAHHGHWGDLLAAGDFDGDGYADLVVGGQAAGQGAGAVTIVRGSRTGLRVKQRQQLTPAHRSSGYLVSADGLAVGDINGDGRDELAVTGLGLGPAAHGLREYENFVDVISDAGTSKRHVWTYRRSNAHLEVKAAAYSNEFGTSLTIGDFDGDGYGDLAISDIAAIPKDSATVCQPDGQCYGSGAVLVLHGSPSGPSARRRQLISQDTRGVPGASVVGNSFGARLAAGDLNGDGRDDLVVRSWGRQGGVANIVYGNKSGLTGHGAQVWSVASPGIAGGRPSGNFGGYLQVGNYGGGSADDLAISAFTKTIAGASSAGAVHLLYGRPAGLSATGSQFWSQHSPGVTGTSEGFDEFGVIGSGSFENVGG